MNDQNEYIQSVYDKFSKNPNDPGLNEQEKMLLGWVKNIQKEIEGLKQQISVAIKEIKEKQETCQTLNEQIIHREGKIQGYLESLATLHGS